VAWFAKQDIEGINSIEKRSNNRMDFFILRFIPE